MQIENIEESKKLLVEVENLFNSLDEVKKGLEKELYIKEDETQDYLHELELGNLNGIDIMKTSKRLIKTRKERRVIKNKLEVLNTLKGYTDKYINKGIITETRQVIKNLDTLEENWKNRSYNAKVVEDLKCARKIKN